METLLNQGYVAFCLIVLLGIILGRIRIKGISLDISAVIFVALVFGHYGIVVPPDFQNIGLLFFIFTIGIQAGPGFFSAFQHYGRQLILLTVAIVGSAMILAIALGLLFHLDFKIVAGLLTGALTSTPGLAAAIEATKSPLASIGYGVAYPFGVIGVILFVRVIVRVMHVDLKTVEQDYEHSMRQHAPVMEVRNFVIENPKLDGKTFEEVEFFHNTGTKISRIMHQDLAATPTRDTVFHLGDIVKAVGPQDALEQLEVLIGQATQQEIPLSPQYDVRLVLVTNKAVVNKSLEELHLLPSHNVTVTRIRRGGVDISPNPTSRLQLSDRLMVACEKENMQQVINTLGDEDTHLSHTDVLPIFLGIILGMFLGKFSVQLPGGASVSLGSTGGILLTTIFLSKIGRTGPIIWSISGAANSLLRQLGLLFFLSAVGTKAGTSLVATVGEHGLVLLLVGVLLTIIPMTVGLIIGHYGFHTNILTLMGGITGAMTSTPGLGAVDVMTASNAPAVAYATAYPFAMVCVIIASQIIGRI